MSHTVFHLTKFLECISIFGDTYYIESWTEKVKNALKSLGECIVLLRLIETVNYLLLL